MTNNVQTPGGNTTTAGAVEGLRRHIVHRWRVRRSVERDHHGKTWPAWAKGKFAILGYLDQGFVVAVQPSGKRVGSGPWGSDVVEYSDGAIGVLPNGEVALRRISDHLKGQP